MEFDIEKVINKMKVDSHPLFVSERHLQVYFVLKAKEVYPSYIFIPEYVYKDSETYHIDLMVSDGKEYIAFEFKYVVAGGTIKVPGNDEYPLRNHSAIDIRRHQCVRDVYRLEHYLDSKDIICKKGYFLLITNMSGFWIGSCENSTASEFDIKDNSTLKKGIHKPTGNTRFANEYKPIEIRNNYGIKYKNYVDLDSKYGSFKYLVIEVK